MDGRIFMSGEPGARRPLIVSSDTGRAKRIPPGQSETKKWPVLHYGEVPRVNVATWDFRLWGLVENEWRCGWDEFRNLPWIDVKCDIHCVTRWSRLDNVFSGPSTRTVMEKAGIKPEGKFVLVHGEGGFTTNLSMQEFLADDCLFAIEHDGKPLTPDHGFPVRLVVPRLYFWKSAKWVRGVEVTPREEAGFWEQNGYHMHGDPWAEERHSW
jgi:DMSO/TMAO reductase YedYZ molybdopterin-dependent catalytic subunit